jgi:hypothetical protein
LSNTGILSAASSAPSVESGEGVSLGCSIGVVTRSTGSGDDEQVTVIFSGHAEKKLILGYAKLVKL